MLKNFRSSLWYSFFVALLGGVLLSLAWPGIGNLTPLVFLAWLPFLWLEKEKSGKSLTLPIYLGFVTWNALTTGWIFYIQESFLTKVVSTSLAVLANAALMTGVFWLFHFTKRQLGNTAGYASLLFYWVGFEYTHLNWELEWPWLNMGNVFANQTQWIQWYEYTGALGGTLWILVVNLLLFWLIQSMMNLAKRNVQVYKLIAVLVLFGIGPFAFSKWMLGRMEEKGNSAEILVVQPNIDPYMEKFSGLSYQEQLSRMNALAETAITANTKYVVFPETALLEPTRCYLQGNQIVKTGLWESQLSSAASVVQLREDLVNKYDDLAVVTGMSSRKMFELEEPLTPAARKIESLGRHYESYNAALQVDASDQVQRYYKSKLVPGVEFIPFSAWLKPLNDLAIDMGGTYGSLGVQQEREVFRHPSADVAPAPIICYESIFGAYVAEYVKNGANLLFIITNDGWWGDSPGYLQHLSYARLRAVETRRSVARAANTGISCFINQRGELLSKTDWWVQGTLSTNLQMNNSLTFYVVHGDYLGRIAGFLSVLIFCYAWVQRVKNRKKSNFHI